jgi:hypothetical protein
MFDDLKDRTTDKQDEHRSIFYNEALKHLILIFTGAGVSSLMGGPIHLEIPALLQMNTGAFLGRYADHHQQWLSVILLSVASMSFHHRLKKLLYFMVRFTEVLLENILNKLLVKLFLRKLT